MNKVKRLVLDKLALSRGQLSEYVKEPNVKDYPIANFWLLFKADFSNYWYYKGIEYVCRELLKAINEAEIESALNDVETEKQIKEFMKE